jgi:SAM-dependent methyltransferase
MQRIDKDANRAFYDSGLPAERSRFQVDPSKLHTAGLLVPWVLAALNPGDRVLDVAGGAGSYASEIVRRADVSVVGIDISEAMVRQRREDDLLSANAVADMEALPFEAGTFDAAMVVAALHHVPDPIPALREILRVLRPGGTLLAYEPCSITARRVGRKGVPGMSHEFAVSRPWLLARFHDAGFTIQKVRGANLAIRAISPVTGPPSLRVYRAADAVDRFACPAPGPGSRPRRPTPARGARCPSKPPVARSPVPTAPLSTTYATASRFSCSTNLAHVDVIGSAAA